MQLTLYTDYSLRVLIYLSLNSDSPATISQAAEFYDISKNHLVKVVHNLAQKGFIQTTRGKNGGMTLARPANEIIISEVVLATEPNFDLVECFSADSTTSCQVLPICSLKSILEEGMRNFIHHLSQYTLADVTPLRSMDKSVLHTLSALPIHPK